MAWNCKRIAFSWRLWLFHVQSSGCSTKLQCRVSVRPSRLETGTCIPNEELQVPPQWGHTQYSREIYDSCGWFNVIQLPMEDSQHTWCRSGMHGVTYSAHHQKIYQSQNPLESTIQKFCSIIFHMCASPVFHHSSGSRSFTFKNRENFMVWSENTLVFRCSFFEANNFFCVRTSFHGRSSKGTTYPFFCHVWIGLWCLDLNTGI